MQKQKEQAITGTVSNSRVDAKVRPHVAHRLQFGTIHHGSFKGKPRPFVEPCKKHPAWKRWIGMKGRAKIRGITVCKRWQIFWNFFTDMGSPPAGTVLDRIDNAKGYEPGNCRWANYKLSTENRRNTVWLDAFGTKMRVNDLAFRLKIPAYLIYLRLNMGWSVADIIKYPKPGRHGFTRHGVPLNPRKHFENARRALRTF